MLHLQDVQYFGPLLEGPLPKAVADSFRSSTYVQGVLKEDRILYRVASSRKGLAGSFLTAEKPLGKLQVIGDAALIPEYGNSASLVATLRIPKGTVIFEGVVGPQQSMMQGAFRTDRTVQELFNRAPLGGGSQIYLHMSPSEIEKFIIEVESLP